MKIEEIYKKIGQGLSDSSQGEWTSAMADIRILPDSFEYSCYYFIEDNKKKAIADLDFEDDLIDALTEMHGDMNKNGANKWNRAKFTVMPDGKFKMDFVWDQALEDEYQEASKN